MSVSLSEYGHEDIVGMEVWLIYMYVHVYVRYMYPLRCVGTNERD